MDTNDRPSKAEQPAAAAADAAGSRGWTTREQARVTQSAAFKELMRRKKAFIVPALLFFTVFYMALPILAELTTVLDGQALGAMTWAYIYGFAQFPMALIVCHLYISRTKVWDELAEEARQEASGKVNNER